MTNTPHITSQLLTKIVLAIMFLPILRITTTRANTIQICNQATMTDGSGNTLARGTSDDTSITGIENPTCISLTQPSCTSLTSDPGRIIQSHPSRTTADISVTCTTNGEIADTIAIKCGNSTGVTGSNALQLTTTCSYTTTGSYNVSCLINDEPAPQAICDQTFDFSVQESPPIGVCGDGEYNAWEDCDTGFNGINNNRTLDHPDINGRMFANLPNSTISNPSNYSCYLCQLYSGTQQTYYISSGNSVDDYQPYCSYLQSSISVNKNIDILPFWIDSDLSGDAQITTTCQAGQEYHIMSGSATCDFGVWHNNILYGTFTKNCFDNERFDPSNPDQPYPLFTTFENEIQAGIINQPGRFFLDTGAIAANTSLYLPSAPIGEYQFRLQNINYDYCGSGAVIIPGQTTQLCQTNFVLADRYVAQQGSFSTIASDQFADSFDLSDFQTLDGTNLFDAYALNDTQPVILTGFSGGNSINTLLEDFIDKYTTLATLDAGFGDLTDTHKAPDKNIYLTSGNVTFNSANTPTVPSTLIIRSGNLTIIGDLPGHHLYLVPDGQIIFDNANTCNDSQEVTGLFITQNGFLAQATDTVHNHLLTQPRCYQGRLTIQGGLVGSGIHQLPAPYRSDFADWFYSSLNQKQNIVFQGAAVYIATDPEIRINPPDGFDELSNPLNISFN